MCDDLTPEQDYHDIDGNPITLDTLRRREPEWAANNIRPAIISPHVLLSADALDRRGIGEARCDTIIGAYLAGRGDRIVPPVIRGKRVVGYVDNLYMSDGDMVTRIALASGARHVSGFSAILDLRARGWERLIEVSIDA